MFCKKVSELEVKNGIHPNCLFCELLWQEIFKLYSSVDKWVQTINVKIQKFRLKDKGLTKLYYKALF